MMRELIPTDPAGLSSMTEGTILRVGVSRGGAGISLFPHPPLTLWVWKIQPTPRAKSTIFVRVRVMYKFNCTRQLHESIVVMWLCKCEVEPTKNRVCQKLTFKTLKLIKSQPSPNIEHVACIKLN
jgi:hypothetical protein